MIRPRLAVAIVVVTAAALAVPGVTSASGASAQNACPQFFVAPHGSDHGAGTLSSPWLSIQHARDYIRDNKLNSPQQMHCDITVNLLAGEYRVTKEIDFTGADSGANGYQVIYRSYDGPGRAQLLGSQRVTSRWQPYQGDIYRAYVGAGRGIYTLYANGQRVTTARTPTRTAAHALAPYLTTTGVNGSYTQLTYAPGDISPAWNLNGAQVVVWSGGTWSWFTDTVPIASVDYATDTITLSEQTRYPLYQYGHGSRYFLQNSLSFLTAPNEYYYDPAAGYLYYWPSNGSIRGQDVEIPVVQTILNIAGASTSDRVQDLEFDGLGLRYTNFTYWYRYGWVTANGSGENHEYPGYDRQIEMTQFRYGTITMTNTHDVTLNALNVTETGFHAIYMLFANDHDTVSNSEIGDTGANGIKVEGPYPGEGNLATENVFTDNYIHNVGELDEGDAAAIKLMDSSDDVVSRSLFTYSPRYAVAWAVFPDIATADNYGYGEQLSYLKIEHMGLDSGDMGAIYAYETDNQPSSVKQVTINDVWADPSMPDVPPSGINMDFGTCGISFADVQVTHAEKTQFNSGDNACYPTTNVTWTGTFDPSQMEYSQIGLAKNFPYPVASS
jgi:hypothetical protein